MAQTWDVIVVGSGSGGAAFAARVAAGGRRVLVLEAGPDLGAEAAPHGWRSVDPREGIYGLPPGDHSWPELSSVRTTAQEPRRFFRGWGSGGSSIINGLMAIRPPVDDFDAWAADGCRGWGFDEVLPYLRMLEDDRQFGSAAYHGRGGPIPVDRFPDSEWGAVDIALRDAALGRGFPWAEDVNAPGATGVSRYPVNSRDGLRVSVNDAYLAPARARGDLELLGDRIVDRVLFDGRRAVGVVLASGEEVRGGRVVLSGGAVGSPTILMRSGIGPAGLLGGLGIPVLSDLPVGRGLSDHPVASVSLPLLEEFRWPYGRRPFNCCVRYASGPGGLGNDMMIVSATGVGDHVVEPGGAQDHEIQDHEITGALWAWVNRAYSTGTVEIRSADPGVPPVIDHNLLSDERDVVRLRDGVRLVAELVDSPAMRRICEGDPWRANAELRAALDGGDDDVDAWLRSTVDDANHTTSTCRMGDEDDPRSVVDPDGRVIGVEGLWVADASILPYSPRSNTHLVSIMTGEVAAARFLAG